MEKEWLKTCPEGSCRSCTQDGRTWTIDRRSLDITQKGGSSSVLTINTSQTEGVQTKGAPVKEDFSSWEELGRFWETLMCDAPAAENQGSYVAFQQSLRAFLETVEKTLE